MYIYTYRYVQPKLEQKFAPPYAILLIADLEEKILNAFEEKTMRKLFIWKHGEESLEKFFNKLNSFHPTLKFTDEHSKETINFLDVNIRFAFSAFLTLIIARTEYHIVKL